MPMTPFFERFPDLAARETRSMILPRPTGGLPAGRYGILELYCDEPGCDCRRVVFEVVEESRPNTPLAIINYGWESEQFYAAKLGGDRDSARQIRAGSLDPLNPQSELAPALLRLLQEVVLQDPAYVARLGRHYGMVKAAQSPPSAAPAAKAPVAADRRAPSPAPAQAASATPSGPRPPTAEPVPLPTPPTARPGAVPVPNLERIDDAVLALLHLTSFSEGGGQLRVTRAWKTHDWAALQRLQEKGLVGDPRSKAKSIMLTDEGRQRAEELFRRLFCD